jgi:hypothetical protein
MLVLPSWVLDGDDHDFFQCFVEDVVNEVRIATGHQLADTFSLLPPADTREKGKGLE